MPSADFCPAVRLPCDSLSPLRTQGRSPGVSSTAFHAQSPDLRFAPLMEMDFAVSCPLVRHWRLISGSCPSTRTFAIRFFQTPPRGSSPCVLASPSPPSGWAGDLHPQTAEHAQHTTKPLCGNLGCERLSSLPVQLRYHQFRQGPGSGLMSGIAIYGSSNTTPISWGVAPKQPYFKNAHRRCYNHRQTRGLRVIKHFYLILINTP
jgi:hypothetical protein